MRLVTAPPDLSTWPARLHLLPSTFVDADGRIEPISSLASLCVDALQRKAVQAIGIMAACRSTQALAGQR